MNPWHMIIQFALSCKACVTNVGFERFFFFMNTWHMIIQFTVFCKSRDKCSIGKVYFPFMNSINMAFHALSFTLGLDTTLLLLSTQLDRPASPKEHYLQLLLSHNIRVNACRGSVETEHHYIPVHLTIVPIRK